MATRCPPTVRATASRGTGRRSSATGSAEAAMAQSDTAEILALLRRQAEQSRYVIEMQVWRAWLDEMDRPRNADPKRLLRHGYKVYSQNDEDGIIAEIFRRIGVVGKTFVEFGVETGVECNTAKLLVEGFRGLWIEANAA